MYEKYSFHFWSPMCDSKRIWMEPRRILGKTLDRYKEWDISSIYLWVRHWWRHRMSTFDEWNRIKIEHQWLFYYIYTDINEAKCFKDFNQFRDEVIKYMDTYRTEHPLTETKAESSPSGGSLNIDAADIQLMHGIVDWSSGWSIWIWWASWWAQLQFIDEYVPTTATFTRRAYPIYEQAQNPYWQWVNEAYQQQLNQQYQQRYDERNRIIADDMWQQIQVPTVQW